MVGCEKMPEPSLICTFDVLAICLQYTLSVEWYEFGFTCLITVMSKNQSPTVKGSVCNTRFGNSNYNSLLRPANNNGFVIMEVKIKVKYNGYVPFEPFRVSGSKDTYYFLGM